MANNLKDHLKEVADAIRAKKGTTDLINPQDFATEIEGISGGSGDGSNWRYFAVYDGAKMYEFSMCSSLIKVNDSAMGIQILSSAGTNFLENFSLLAMAYDMNRAIYLTGPEGVVFTTVGDIIEYILGDVGAGMDYLGAEITEEEFYRIPDTSHDGCYIQHIDGTLYTADQWTNGGFSNDEANGIAVVNESRNISFVVAKETLGSMPWSSMPDTLIEGITTTTEWDEATADKAGVENTAIIAAADPNSAAAACANYTFPNGQKGYLMSSAEGGVIYNFEGSMKPLTQLLGMTWADYFCWTTTQYDATKAWYVRLTGLFDTHYLPKSSNQTVCPVCTLENYKFPQNA